MNHLHVSEGQDDVSLWEILEADYADKSWKQTMPVNLVYNSVLFIMKSKTLKCLQMCFVPLDQLCYSGNKI